MIVHDRISVAMTGLAYFALAAATIYWTSGSGSGGVATIWPASAILLAAIWTLPRSRWLPYFAAGFAANLAANLLFHQASIAAVPFAFANMAEVLIAALLLGRTRDSSEAFASVGQVLRFAAVAGVIAPAISGLIGAATAFFTVQADFARTYLTWYAADALGLLIVAPVALMLRDGEIRRWYRQLAGPARSHTAVLLLVVVVTALFSFGQSRYPLLFFVFGPTILAACRLGRIGAALSVVIVAIIGSVATLHGAGPISLVDGDEWTKIVAFQLFIAVLIMTALPAAAELDKRRLLIARLAEREAALLLMMDQSSDLILNFDRDGTCRFASGSSSSLAAYTPGIMVGSNVADLPHPSDAAKAKANHHSALADPATAHRCEFRLSDSEGNWFWVEASTRALTDEDGAITGTVSVLRDVSHHKRQEADLRLAASTDPLTGVANRAGFLDAFDHLRAAAPDASAWVGLLDLDHFKSINDRHGHLAGDKVLKVVANRLRAELRADDVVGRIGGEEFAVILAGCSEEVAGQVFERLRAAVAQSPILVSGREPVSVTLSAGFVPLAPDQSRESILAAADEALYFSKRAGRNRVTIGITGSDTLAA